MKCFQKKQIADCLTLIYKKRVLFFKAKAIFAGMTSDNRFYSSTKARIFSALLFSLSLLVLVVSCPLKKLLHNESAESTRAVTRSNQTNINNRTDVEYSSASNNCRVRDVIVFVKSDLSQPTNVQAPVYFANVINATGFNVNYYLSRLSFRNADLTSNTSSLPLFLQHLQLLI
jgi:hypothetical protein